MAAEEERALIAPCGLYCGTCALFKARKDREFRARLAEERGIPVEELFLCAGCRPMRGQVKAAGGQPVCDTYACIEGKGLDFCYQCHDFPCLKLAPCIDKHDKPHNTKVYNLVLLQKLGIEEWLKRKERLLAQYRYGKKLTTGGDLEYQG